ncbi:Uma2 family endonuclease [Halorhodospira halophila]|uniref:Putative restriction endonuclease domain-containing protein n=1 Tax=Halorhodospira halophila (strain DSM 244 / SL1) TaxID=349124 RepID=A1WYC6_HALHL|nr:Uma2 family endonuclease [Halorhodospira halophila]ABM62688.1 protein of unknown function DUF820 [Halorhodospira halophila SL1]MBK1728369.1 Uma2 family endonuclease [Halorhodospira halophila]
MADPQPAGMTAEAYLAWEAEQPLKHEFVAGEIFAMGGASDRHVTVTLNVASALRQQLRGGGCRTYMADMKVRVAAADAFFYPDVLVTCDPADHQRSQHKEAPCLVVEVLSPSTAAYDRGAKFAAYRKLPSLREYLLIDPEIGSLELYRADGQGHWVLYPHEAHEEVVLASLEARLIGAEVFEDAPPGPEPR